MGELSFQESRRGQKRYYIRFYVKGRRVQKTMGNKKLAMIIFQVLKEYQDIENARKFLKEAARDGLLNEEQVVAINSYIDEEYRVLSTGQKEQIKIMVKELRNDQCYTRPKGRPEKEEELGPLCIRHEEDSQPDRRRGAYQR